MAEYTDALRDVLNDDSISFTKAVTGGIVNKAGLFTSASCGRRYFVKYNERPEAEAMFGVERASLELLHSTGIVRVPHSLKVCRVSEALGSVHVLEYVEDLQPLTDHWPQFGQQIARLHRLNGDLLAARGQRSGRVGQGDLVEEGEPSGGLEPRRKFGSDTPHFIGTFPVAPVWRDSWQEYFIRDILDPLVQGLEPKYRDQTIRERWSWLKHQLHKVFEGIPIHPSINHGDLCPANFGQTKEEPILFDPAVHFAHSEFDLLLSATEGGFSPQFFTAYHQLVPQVSGWEERLEVYKLFYNVVMWYHLDEDAFKEVTHTSMATVTKLLQDKFES